MAMERTRIAKVEDVSVARRGEQLRGTLHLTPYHLIFVHTPLSADSLADGKPQKPRELWITYPIISFCTLRPAPAASRQPSSIRLRCRDFSFVCFYFTTDTNVRDVFDSIKAWTTKLGRIEKLYAFTYLPQPPEKSVNSWGIYNPMQEWRRMGVGDDLKKSNWRISRINVDYGFCPTYPALLPVPAAISDNTLNYAGRYRSRARIPVLTYLHPVNSCSITRCAQPMVGVRQNRSIQDEKLLAAIFATTRTERPLSNLISSPLPEREDLDRSKLSEQSLTDGDIVRAETEAIEDAVIPNARGDDDGVKDEEGKTPLIYGAQQRNMIVDARPTVNAYAMQAVGLGSENMDNYKFATKAYLGIDNIHVMRESLQKVIDALKDSDVTPLPPNREILNKSGWLRHISNLLDGVALIARQVGLQHSHVLIHCSDGWDRTSQLSSLSQICLDPYYRTIEGFIVLVEKDWLSFGHMFRHRSGFLNSDKWFHIENERIGGSTHDTDRPKGQTNEAMDATKKTLENAFLSARGFFASKNHNDSRESLTIDSDAEQLHNYDSDSNSRRIASASNTTSTSKSKKETPVTKVKETAPIFHQFLDATYQLLYQHPTRFEFSDRFLRRLLYHLYSCQYGTFLYDNEKDRLEAKIYDRTRSVWDYFLSRKYQFVNDQYDGGDLDDHIRGKERMIFPRIEEVRWWSAGFGRTDEEMNTKIQPQSTNPTALKAAWIAANGTESLEESPSESETKAGSRTPVLTSDETNYVSVGASVAPSFQSTENELTAALTEQLSSSMSKSIDLANSAQVIEEAVDTGRVQEYETAHQGDKHDASQDAVIDLALDLDPLGIGDVKDREPIRKNQRLREQMGVLMQ